MQPIKLRRHPYHGAFWEFSHPVTGRTTYQCDKCLQFISMSQMTFMHDCSTKRTKAVTKNAIMLHLMAQGFVLANSVKDTFLSTQIDQSVVPPGQPIRIHRGTYWLPETNWVALEDAGYPYGATLYMVLAKDRAPREGYKTWFIPTPTRVVVLNSSDTPMFPKGRIDIVNGGVLLFSIVSNLIEDNR